MAEQHFNSIGVIGLGLMGGSFALAAKARWPGVEVHAYDPSPAAQEWGQTNSSMTLWPSIAELAAVSELIVIAAPLPQFQSIMTLLGQSLARWPDDDSIIIDLASTKVSAVRQAEQLLATARVRFVACHPIAGSELSGAWYARADLFRNKPVVVTPEDNTSAKALQLVEHMWQALGAQVVTMAADKHDELLAYLSHAPHLLAFVYMLQSNSISDDQLALAGGGFRDFTRIAASNPELWADILLDNSAAVVALLEQQRKGIADMVQLLGSRQREPLIKALSAARDRRAGLG